MHSDRFLHERNLVTDAGSDQNNDASCGELFVPTLAFFESLMWRHCRAIDAVNVGSSSASFGLPLAGVVRPQLANHLPKAFAFSFCPAGSEDDVPMYHIRELATLKKRNKHAVSLALVLLLTAFAFLLGGSTFQTV